MTATYAKHFSTKQTLQSEPIPGSKQVPNSAGGHSFAVDDWTRLDRFLILGNEGGSYYASERKLTVENAGAVLRCWQANPERTAIRIAEISDAGRAPKNDPAIFALAVGSKHPEALAVLGKVCRIGTHIFQFAEAVQSFRGWGRALRKSISKWYTEREPRELAYQVSKYQQRNGWTHRDLLRLSHPKADGPLGTILKWAAGKQPIKEIISIPELEPIIALEHAQKAGDKQEIVRLIQDHDLVRECIPTRFLSEPEVWEALLEKMPLTAMIRNLATMTRIKLIGPFSQAASKAAGRLSDKDRIRKTRVHPLALLVALKTYAQGHGERGKSQWQPVPQITDALDRAFYLAFDNVVPTGGRWYLGIDVSGSMGCSNIAGLPGVTPRDGATAMALVTASVEPNWYMAAFSHGMVPFSVTPRCRLDDVLRTTNSIPMGGTDCALPMLDALERKWPVDAFVVYTDSETWFGGIHPVQALRQYRDRIGIAAKLIVVGMVSNGFTIADPDDGGMMDVVGFDTATPQIIADFVL